MEWFPIANGIVSYCEWNSFLLRKEYEIIRQKKACTQYLTAYRLRYIYIRESLLFITLTILLL